MRVKFLKDTKIEDTDIVVDSIVDFPDDVVAKSYIEKGDAIEFTEEVEKEEEKTAVEKELNDLKAKNVNVAVKIGKEDKMSDYIIGKAMVDLRKKAVTGMSEGTAADGGALLGTAVSEMLSVALEGGVIYPKCRKIRLAQGFNSCKIVTDTSDPLIRANAPVITAPAEGGDKTATKLAFGNYTASLVKQVLYVPVTDELLDDAVNLDGYIREYLRGKAAADLDVQILNGTAASSGLIGITTAGAAAYVVAEAWTTPTLAQVTAFMRGVHPSLNPEWYMSPTQWANVIAAFVGTASNANGMIVNPAAMTLMGKKVNVMAGMLVGTAVVYGDFSTYAIVEPNVQQGMKISDQIRFYNDETVYRLVNRFAGGPTFVERTIADGTTVAGFTADDGLSS